jgi:hypothetical protein
LALKPKTHTSNLLLLIEKNIFVSGGSVAEETVNNMQEEIHCY